MLIDPDTEARVLVPDLQGLAEMLGVDDTYSVGVESTGDSVGDLDSIALADWLEPDSIPADSEDTGLTLGQSVIVFSKEELIPVALSLPLKVHALVDIAEILLDASGDLLLPRDSEKVIVIEGRLLELCELSAVLEVDLDTEFETLVVPE